jgi:hypothetical protein
MEFEYTAKFQITQISRSEIVTGEIKSQITLNASLNQSLQNRTCEFCNALVQYGFWLGKAKSSPGLPRGARSSIALFSDEVLGLWNMITPI